MKMIKYKNKEKREIVDLVQKKQGGSKEDIWVVSEFQWKFVAKTMREGLFNSVRLPYLGKFSVSLFRLLKINNRNKGNGDI